MTLFFRTSLHFVLLLAIPAMAAFAQTAAKSGQTQREWRKQDLKLLSFVAPMDLKSVATKCADSICHRFESDALSMSIDVTIDIYRPTFERDLPDYKDKRFWLNEPKGIWAWVWSFQAVDGENRFRVGALFSFRDCSQCKVGMTFRSPEPVSEIAEQIIRSVTFKKGSSGSGGF